MGVEMARCGRPGDTIKRGNVYVWAAERCKEKYGRLDSALKCGKVRCGRPGIWKSVGVGGGKYTSNTSNTRL